MAEKIAAKYLGDGSEYHNGIPARSLTEDEFEALPDEHKATLAASKLYELRHDAPAAAEKATKRAEKAEPAVEAPFMVGESGSEKFTPELVVEAKK